MGFGSHLKMLFGSKKKEEKKDDEEVIEEPIENKEEINEELAQPRNFKYLDDLIHSGVKDIVLDSDIVLDENEYVEYLEGIDLNIDDLVIHGNGFTIDAQEKTRLFYCTSKNIVLKNVTLKNGNATKYGGGAIINEGTLTITDSTLTENTAQGEYGGGAIINEGTLTITDSTLTENTASHGGAIHNEKGTITIIESALNNNASRWHGGAICNLGSKVTITDSTITENTTLVYGGAIYNRGDLTIIESTITENTANNGGAIHNENGAITITESSLTENTAKYSGGAIHNKEGAISITKSAFIANTARNLGGAIHHIKCSINVINCDFSFNKSPTSIIENEDSFQIFNSNYRSNDASNIIVNHADLANFSISNGKFKDNYISESIIFNDGKLCTVEKTIFEKHLFNTIINKSNLTLINPKIKDEGKLILNEKYILIKKSPYELEDKIYGDGVVENENKFNFKKYDFGYLDKKIHESKTKEIILEEDISFENYEIDYYEGGIELDIDNLILDGNGHTIDAKEKTRIFHCTGKNITLKNITLKNGHSHQNYGNPFNNNGGAIKINHNANLTIENCKFINNTSEEYAGVIYNKGKLTVSSSTFIENIAERDGGAIHNSGELFVSDSTLQGNTTKDDGGALYNDENSVLTVSGSTFIENIAERDGGAIHNSGELFVSDSTLQGNTVEQDGGAIRNSGGLTVYDSTFTENTAKYRGGAIYNNDGTLFVSDSILQGNTVERDGGAISNWEDGELTITESALTENTTQRDGGAIYNWEGRVSVSDSTLKGNTAKSNGGAIYNWEGRVSVSDSTLKGNTAKSNGGAINNINTKSNIKNCKFKNNKPEDVEYQETMDYDVFICFSTENSNIANDICYFLEQNNLKCWIAPRNIKSCIDEITDAVKSAKMVVLIFSHYSQVSKHVNNEIDVAFSHEKPIILFNIDETIPEGDMEHYLKNCYYLDAYPNPEDENTLGKLIEMARNFAL